jgi:TatD DNase family protein
VVDTHAHIGLCDDEAAAIVGRAEAAGVQRILTVGLDEGSNREAIDLAREHGAVFACVGRHPNSATGFGDEAAAALRELAERAEVVAVGETGLDYYRDRAPREDQLRAFEAQIGIAREVGKPVVIHMRESADDTFRTLQAQAGGVQVILHCFSAPPERVAEAAAAGWYCSFAGNVTYPKAEALRDAARLVPDELLLVETDSPFLAPQSRRGKATEPALVVEAARELAAARGIQYEELEALVEANASGVFGW